MKKNISINISGIIFHIEEDSYPRLKQYLDAINQHFSSYDESSEIVNDIENRIAEILLKKLKGGKQVIVEDDIISLINTMGTIADFEAAEALVEEETSEQKKTQESTSQNDYKHYDIPDAKPKKLYRNEAKKVLGGVFAGIAHYFSIDPLWLRLFALLLFFSGFIKLSSDGDYSISINIALIVIYIILWIVLPAEYYAEEDGKTKKLFRSSEGKIFGGVSAGLAAYFGIDKDLVRVLFIILAFVGGSGILLYLILWIITPTANSLTDKMQMQGQPITLDNIEKNIKTSLNVPEDKKENVFLKVLLFPFRLISYLLKGLGNILSPILNFLIDAIRIIFGIFLILVGGSLSFGILVMLVAYFNVAGGDILFLNELPSRFINENIPLYMAFAAFAGVFVPSLIMIILGVMVIIRRNLIRAYIGWSLFGIWLIAIVTLAASIPLRAQQYKQQGTYKEEKVYALPQGTPYLTQSEVGDDEYDGARLILKGHEANEIRIEKKFTTRGFDRAEAEKIASETIYGITVQDSIFTFDSNVTLPEDTKFRFQQAVITMYIPFNKPFKLDEKMRYLMGSYIFTTKGYSAYALENKTWVMTENGIKCASCAEPIEEADESTEVSQDTVLSE